MATLNDRHLAARVRTKLLKEIEAVLNGDDFAYKKEIMLKMATTLLPRLNEVTGEDGSSIKITVSKEIAEHYETPCESSSSGE
jgi:hypothetical protein